MAVSAMPGTLFAVPFIFAFFDQERGDSAWQWIVFGPFILIGAVFWFQYWRMRSGADLFFGLTGDRHGSARFTSRKELTKHQGGDGLLIGAIPAPGGCCAMTVPPI